MTREQLEIYIAEEYGVSGEQLWDNYPGYAVFRHTGNKKWFAIVMDVPENKMGIPLPEGAEPGMLDILDVKCDPALLGSLWKDPGFYPAYHMNKRTWISVDIARIDDETIKALLHMSYALTATKVKPATLRKRSPSHG